MPDMPMMGIFFACTSGKTTTTFTIVSKPIDADGISIAKIANQTYSGKEDTVADNLTSRITSMNMQEKIFRVIVPTQIVLEKKKGMEYIIARFTKHPAVFA